MLTYGILYNFLLEMPYFYYHYYHRRDLNKEKIGDLCFKIPVNSNPV